MAKPTATTAADVVDNLGGLTHYPVKAFGDTSIDIYVPSASVNVPKWTRLFDPHVPPGTFGHATAMGALVVLKHNKRLYALSFGTGRFKLKQECWEENFGLRVALNCIGTNVVKCIDKHTLDSLSRHTREQASREATAGEFGLDVEQDLLRAVTGTPTDPAFGKWISGTDTLHISVPVALTNLPDLMEKLNDKFLDTSYQTTFPWVDQIAQVRDAAIVALLDEQLVQGLRAGNRKLTWMAVPEVIEWDNVGGFRFPGSKGPRVEHHDIHLQHFLDAIGDLSRIDIDMLMDRSVECVDPDGNPVKRWRVHKCLYSEIDFQGESYLLSAGNWYRVRQSFVNQVNAAVKAIQHYDAPLPEFDDASEGRYVIRVAKENAGFAPMDGKNIVYGGGASRIEFCDILTAQHDLIHIKRYGQSAALSHLFAQGLTSGELFQTDPDFRKALNGKLPLGHPLMDPLKRPRHGEYRVVFGVVSDRPGPLTLPFFSRLNLKHAVRRLEGYGFRVAIAKIEVSTIRAKLQRVRNRKRAA